jgi:flagellar assembly factor FliW
MYLYLRKDLIFMYKFVSSRFGELEIEDDKILNFKNGILAFEDSKRFILLNSAKESFYWLQSLDEPDLALPCMDPNIIVEQYSPDIPDEIIESIGVKDESDVTVLGIVRIPEEIKDSTVNLIAPIVINHNTRQGVQVVLDDSRYTVRHRIFE